MAELEQEEMSFWDHLEALRWTLFRSFLALFIFAIGSFAFMRGSDGIFDRVVLAPCYSDFIFYRWLCDLNQWLVNVSPWFDVLPDFCNDNFHVDVFNIRLASQFFTHMTTSFWLALVLTFPYLMWEIWKFISPALYENEKKNVKWVFLLGTIMFFIGCAVGGFKGITGKYVDLSDGMFEVTLVKVPRSLDELNQTLAALAQRDIDTAQMYCFKTSWLKVETEEEVAWTLDGEFGGRHTEIVIENQKQALHIMVPGEEKEAQ